MAGGKPARPDRPESGESHRRRTLDRRAADSRADSAATARSRASAPLRKPEPYGLEWVSVVVVVTGLGTVVFSVVVVVLTGLGTVVSSVVVVVLFAGSALFSFTVVQADSDTMAAAARHGRIRFFMNTIVVWIITLQYEITPSVGHILWGVTLRGTRR